MSFSDYFALCGAMSPLGKLVLASDLGIALAYFAIPVGLLIVHSRRREDLPYPWMFGLFAAFIVTCGLTHLVHAIQMPWTTFEHTTLEAAVKAVCATLSIATAAALIAVMPAALRMISPRERRLKLEAEIAERTDENRALVREINHRIGNQLQIIASAIRIERRKLPAEAENSALLRVQGVVEELSRRYREVEPRYAEAGQRPISVSELAQLQTAAEPLYGKPATVES